MTLRPCPKCGAPRRPGAACGSTSCSWKPAEQRKRPRQKRGYDADHDRVRRELLAEAAAAGHRARCALCPDEIDTRLPGTHPAGPQLHHVAGKRGGNVRANYALAHAFCNQRAGAPT